MFKKRLTLVEGLMAAFFVFLVAGVAIAGFGSVIATITLNNTTQNTSGVIGYGKQNKGAFFATISSPANSTVVANVSITGSYDGGNWSTLGFYNATNGSAVANPLAVATLTANSTFVFWPTVATPYLNISVVSNASATNTSNITVNFMSER